MDKNIHLQTVEHHHHHTARPLLVTFNRWMLAALAFSTAFPGKIPLPVIWLTGLGWLAELTASFIRTGGPAELLARFRMAGKGYVILAFFLLIILYVAGLAFTDNMGAARFELEKKSLMLLFPLMVFTSHPRVFDGNLLRDILVAFLAGLVVVSLYDMVVAWGNYRATGHPGMLYYGRLSGDHHPVYLSMYSVFALAIIGWFFTGGIPRMRRWHKGVLVTIALWLLLFVFLLSARAGFLSLLLLAAMMGVRVVAEWPVKQWLPIGVVFVVVMVLIFKIFSGPLSARLGAMNHFRMSEEEIAAMEKPDGVVIRMISWRVAWEQFKASPWVGTGTGDYVTETRERIRERGLTEAFGKFMNAHNQYLQTAVTLGIPGLFALLMWLIVPVAAHPKPRSWLHMAFAGILAFNLLSESMLEAQAGVLFAVFFHTMIYRLGGGIGNT